MAEVDGLVNLRIDVLNPSDARKYAETEVKKIIHIDLPAAPDIKAKELRFPEDVTALGDREIGQLLSKYTAMVVFLESQCSLLRIDEHCAEMTLGHYQKLGLASGVSMKGDTVTEKKAKRDLDPKIVNLSIDVEKVKAKSEAMAAVLRGFTVALTTISREITRRSALAGIEGREGHR